MNGSFLHRPSARAVWGLARIELGSVPLMQAFVMKLGPARFYLIESVGKTMMPVGHSVIPPYRRH